jgi:hypothetical protein
MSKRARLSRYNTYNKYGWSGFLPGIAELILGKPLAGELKTQAG